MDTQAIKKKKNQVHKKFIFIRKILVILFSGALLK